VAHSQKPMRDAYIHSRKYLNGLGYAQVAEFLSPKKLVRPLVCGIQTSGHCATYVCMYVFMYALMIEDPSGYWFSEGWKS
jgi:hypothetical protein